MKKAQYLGSIGDKEGALKAYAAMPEKALSTGGKADIAMACARLAFVSGDKPCVGGSAPPTAPPSAPPPPPPWPHARAHSRTRTLAHAQPAHTPQADGGAAGGGQGPQ